MLAVLPVDVETSSSIILTYQLDSILRDFITLTLNATETGSKLIRICSLSVQTERSVHGKKYWAPITDCEYLYSATPLHLN